MSSRRAPVKVDNDTAAKNKACAWELLARLNRMRLARIEAELADIDKTILEVIETDPDLRAQDPVSIAGISEVTAATILTLMPEPGETGKAFVHGGRAALGQALYMPAVVACRFNPDLKAKYEGSSPPESRQRSPLPSSCAV